MEGITGTDLKGLIKVTILKISIACNPVLYIIYGHSEYLHIVIASLNVTFRWWSLTSLHTIQTLHPTDSLKKQSLHTFHIM